MAKQALKQQAEGLSLEQLGMVKLPRRNNGELVRWDAPILATWDISEAAALRILEDFASNGDFHITLHGRAERSEAVKVTNLPWYMSMTALGDLQACLNMKQPGILQMQEQCLVCLHTSMAAS